MTRRDYQTLCDYLGEAISPSLEELCDLTGWTRDLALARVEALLPDADEQRMSHLIAVLVPIYSAQWLAQGR